MQQDIEVLHQQLATLMQEHRELDEAIEQLLAQADHDQFKATRMKKRKLLLKDMIAKISSQLIPDQPA
ncbi:YdcH family protein [Candidatus Thiothrix anitrata]|jgi:hypothetical protein|uniref:YdcH family protein n=1 Tax=Candidatus Thiothrix anitrata TaxID=2823902 RepID=A0ABX7X2T3_9GAMM|nr:YdcH family protein [Candidatus Thiothrix anitrata]QTR50194.1 YdcH family protein [Candidatus Thiothrix anitrata]